MKQIYFLIFTVIISVNTYSQLTITSQGNGLVDVSYGASGDFSLYDPNGEAVVLYLWVDQVMNSGNIYYQDQWSGPLPMVNLTWDGTTYIGTIDFNSHVWDGDTIIPVGTILNDFNILLRNAAGDSQSADLVATTYGYTATTLPVENFQKTTITIFSIESSLYIKGLNRGEKYLLTIYDTTGRLVKKLNTDVNLINVPELKPAVYFLVLETREGNVFKNKIILN